MTDFEKIIYLADKIEKNENASSEFMTFVNEKKESAVSGIKAITLCPTDTNN